MGALGCSSLNTLLCLFVQLSIVVCWNTDGYESIGMTSMSATLPTATARIKAALAGGDLTDIGKWAEKLKQRYPGFSSLQFQMQSQMGDARANFNESCHNGQCLMNAVKHFYAKVAKLSDVPVLEYPQGIKVNPLDALKILSVLIADLHQPMHYGRTSDQAGRTIRGTFFDGTKSKTTTLYQFWDQDVLEAVKTVRPAMWNSGWTHYHQLGRAEESLQRTKWNSANLQQKMQQIEDWADSSYKVALQMCYQTPNGVPIVDGFKFGVYEALHSFELLKRHILLGGLRLSILIESLLAQSALSGIPNSALFSEEPTVHTTISKKQALWMRNAMINFGVLVVVLVIFAYFTRYFTSPLTAYGSITHDKQFCKSGVELQKRS